MKNLINDYCLRLFIGNDNKRPELMKIAPVGEYLYATNTHIVAKIKSDLCVKKYEPVEEYPICEKVILNHVSSGTKTFTVNELFTELMEIEVCFKHEMIDCNECNGDGTCVCEHCDSEYDCKECGGTGRVKGKNMIPSGENNVKIFDRKYKLLLIDMILKTAKYTDTKEITISNGESKTSASLFTVGNFTILLMPVYTGDEEN